MPFQRNEVFRGSKVISLVQSKLSDFRERRRRNLPHRLLLLERTLSLSRTCRSLLLQRRNPKCDENYPVSLSKDPRLLGGLKDPFEERSHRVFSPKLALRSRCYKLSSREIDFNCPLKNIYLSHF